MNAAMTTSNRPCQEAKTSGLKPSTTMPTNESPMPSQRRQRIRSPSSATDSRVANGTPSWLAIATDDMFPDSATPVNISANCRPPLQIAAVNSQRISPRRRRSQGHTSRPTIRNRRKLRNTGGKRSTESLIATMLKPQIRLISTSCQRCERARSFTREAPARLPAGAGCSSTPSRGRRRRRSRSGARPPPRSAAAAGRSRVRRRSRRSGQPRCSVRSAGSSRRVRLTISCQAP